MIKAKRVYADREAEDGYRVLVDRLWPRGVSKAAAHADLWMKDIAPSDALRKWFGHDPERWREFKIRYRKELREKADLLAALRRLERRHRTVTLLFGAKDEERNQAVALAEVLRKPVARKR